jgi:hypothetical protein
MRRLLAAADGQGNFGSSFAVGRADHQKEHPMRTLASAAGLGFVLALAACSQAEQDKTQASANEAASDVAAASRDVGEDVKEGAQKVGAEIKEVTSDPDVKAAASETKEALKDLGSSIAGAARNDEGKAGSTTTTTTTTTKKSY